MLQHKILCAITFDRISKGNITQNIGIFLICMLVGSTLYAKPEIANGATSRQKEIVDGEGFGLPRANARNHAEKCVFARRAAEIDARRALAERIRTQVKSTAKTVNKEISSEETEVFVNETLLGSKIVLVEEDAKCDQVRVKVEAEINLEKITH